MIALSNIKNLAASTYSDLYKEVYGSRPRNVEFVSEAEFEEDYNFLCAELEKNIISEKQQQKEAASDFELRLNDIMFITENMNRKDAIRILIQAENLEEDFDWYGYEVVEFNLNLPYGYIKNSFK